MVKSAAPSSQSAVPARPGTGIAPTIARNRNNGGSAAIPPRAAAPRVAAHRFAAPPPRIPDAALLQPADLDRMLVRLITSRSMEGLRALMRPFAASSTINRVADTLETIDTWIRGKLYHLQDPPVVDDAATDLAFRNDALFITVAIRIFVGVPIGPSDSIVRLNYRRKIRASGAIEYYEIKVDREPVRSMELKILSIDFTSNDN